MDYRIFNVCMQSFCLHIDTGVGWLGEGTFIYSLILSTFVECRVYTELSLLRKVDEQSIAQSGYPSM